MSTNAEYVATMKAQLKKWDADFDAIATRGEKAGTEAYHEGIRSLRASRNAAQKSMEEIRFASEAAGAKMKAGMETTWATMRKALDSATSAFGK
jgi:hypothetical protein